MTKPLPYNIAFFLNLIAMKSNYVLQGLESRIPEALENSTKEQKMIAYRKLLETTLHVKLPRCALRVRTKENPYGKM